MDDLSVALNNSGIGGYLGDAFLNHLCYADDICLISLSQWRSKGGGQGGGICPRAPPGGGRQNPAKEFFKIYIR